MDLSARKSIFAPDKFFVTEKKLSRINNELPKSVHVPKRTENFSEFGNQRAIIFGKKVFFSAGRELRLWAFGR